jgi:hypothetical protein
MNKVKKVIGKLANVQIISAIIWATVMIGCSLILKGNESSAQILNILICGATANMLLLTKVTTEKNIEKEKGNKPEVV